jgi:hypothetical protein
MSRVGALNREQLAPVLLALAWTVDLFDTPEVDTGAS